MSVIEKTLVLNTVFEKLSVTVIDGGRLEYHSDYYEKKRNAFNIDKMINGALAACDVDFAGISKVYAFCGPGSFTGIKLGLSTVFGLMCGSGGTASAKGLSLLDMMLFSALGGKCPAGNTVTALIPGVRGEFFHRSAIASNEGIRAAFASAGPESVGQSARIIEAFGGGYFVVDARSRAFADDEVMAAHPAERVIKTGYDAETVLDFIRYCESEDQARLLPLEPIYLKDTYVVKPKTEIC